MAVIDRNAAVREAEQVAATRGEPADWRADRSHLVKEVEHPGLFSGIGNVLGKALSIVGTLAFIAMPLGAVSRFAVAKLGAGGMAKTAFAKTGQVAGLLTTTTVGDAAKHVGEIVGHDSALARGAHGLSNTVGKHAQKLAGNSSWGKTALENIKGNQLAGTIFSAAGVVQGGYSLLSARSDKAAILQQMQFDLSGEKISKYQALHSKDLNPLVMQARTQSKNWKSRTASLLDMAGIAGNFHLLTSKDGGGNILKNMAATMLPAMGSMMLRNSDSTNTALQAYKGAYLEYAKTGQMSQETIEAMVGGFNPKASSRLVTQVAQQAKANNFTPAEMLKMLSETNFMEPSRSHTARLEAGRGAAPSRMAMAGA